ncbi:MAG TPA: prolyl oligopeptidase family serine peptidase, partial [Gammaproteobacteria bacterium]|nr:prolyl oligopeptidase family serine peptidase [Gammaproteobacteria bacterium]
KVAAPYQWMEDLNSPAVTQWVEAENKLTFSYLDKIPEREWMRQRLTTLWNYEKVGIPQEENGELFFSKNSGLQNQSEVYVQAVAGGEPRVLLDPNTLSADGSVALLDWQPSRDASYLSYALSQGGSDWEELKVRDVKTGQDLSDDVKWVKFSGIAWTKDNKGFFYSRYPEPSKNEAISDKLTVQSLYYHLLGTPQSADKLIYSRPDLSEWVVGGYVSDDGRLLYIVLNHGTSPKNQLLYADLGDPRHPDVGAAVKPLFSVDDAEYAPLGNEGDTLYLQTTRDAPKRQIVTLSLKDPKDSWRTLVPEAKDVIQGSQLSDGTLAVQYLTDAHAEIKLFDEQGKSRGSMALPGIGAVNGLSGRNHQPVVYYSFTSFLYPTSIYRYDVKNGKNEVFFRPKVDFDPANYETRQVFYPSKDGTRVPLFITARKGLKLDGSHPTLLYAYGGFDISVTPSFSPILPVWLELGGVYAVANLRGGGEYGEAWHEAGMFGHKQNVFDDFAYAAKYLVAQGYTSVPKLGISGYSNGGLLVGASITENPQLFGAAYGGAGVMDMLRYQKFSGGALWAAEYGASDDPKAFQWLRAYSPLQNLKDGACYPPTIITTADHDDRVVPSHSYKFAAALQNAQGCDNPVLIRIETKTSHNYMPTDKRIAQTADVWAFMAYNLGVKAAPQN